MAARLTALLPRLLALTVIWLLGAATYTLAADKVPSAKHEQKAEAASKPHVLTVPDVRKKAYVFAKGILQDAGFAATIAGAVVIVDGRADMVSLNAAVNGQVKLGDVTLSKPRPGISSASSPHAASASGATTPVKAIAASALGVGCFNQ